MKKILALLCVAVSVFSLCLATACNNGAEDTTKRNPETIPATVTNYLVKIETNLPDNGAELMLTKQIGNTLFLQYYIGQIQNYFIQNVMTPIYNDGSIKKLTYTESSVTSKTISEGLSKSISTTDSVSVTDSVGTTLSWKFGVSNSTTVSSSAGVDFGIVSAEAGVSDTFTIAAELGGSITANHSETVSKSTTETANSNYEVAYLEQQCRSVAAELDMSIYEKYYYYALGLVADINVYQIIAYDVNTREFYTTYFMSDIDSSNIAIKMLSSQSTSFSIPADVKVFPITDISIDNIIKVENGNTEDFLGGNGTEGSPYLIGNANHFMNIKLYPNANYRLVTNIDMSSITYIPIKEFGGTILGAGRTISNLTYKEESFINSVYVGLFKKNTGNICDLCISDCSFIASPKFGNEDINVYSGTIAAVNTGIIKNCIVKNSTVIANSSNIAEKFITVYNEDPREIIRGSANWKTWISQKFYLKTNSWVENLLFRVYSGGISGLNEGTIENCTFIGDIEANLYNMLISSNRIEQECIAGGITGLNSGSVSSATTTANVSAWIELDHDAGGMGWVGDTYPKAVCFACGLVGNNLTGSILSGQSNGEQKANYRIYAPQYAFLSGANYNSTTKGHKNNLTIGASDTYCTN